MSGFKPVGVEVLFATYAAATVSSVSASPVTITAGWPAIIIPAGYFSNTGDWASTLRFRMGGFLTATATIPTFSWGLAIATTSTFATTSILATATAATAPTSATSFTWKFEAEIGLRTLGASGANSTLVTHGEINTNAFAANAQLAPGGSGNTFTTYDKTLQYWLFPYLTLGAATAGNTVTAQYGKLYGEN